MRKPVLLRAHTCDTPAVLNPHNPARSTGGSSSGAALVASGAVDMAIGGDQGGSIRMPSAWCGIYGLKPTHGLVPYTGAFPIEITLDHLGPMTRSVTDCATLLRSPVKTAWIRASATVSIVTPAP